MDFIDRAKTTTTSTGTGAIVCSATPASVEYQSLSSLAVGKTFPYAISTAGSPEWEVGVGTITAANTFTRAPTASSNGGSLVSFSAGTKDVVCTVTADYLKGSTVLDLPAVTTATTSDYILVTKADGSGSYRVLVSAFATSSSGGTTTPADTTAPTLSSPTATQTGQTTATGTVSTNEANGTLYRYASANATETVPTIEAANLTSTVTATGTQNVSFTGLTAGTTYYAHYVHRDAAGNYSAVANSAGFTTAAASGGTGGATYDTLVGRYKFDPSGTTPAETYTATAGSFANATAEQGGVWSKRFAAGQDGSVQFKVTQLGHFAVLLMGNFQDRLYTHGYLAFGDANDLTHYQALNVDSPVGTPSAISAVVSAVGDVVKVTRTGSTWICSVSKAGGAFVEVGRYTNSYTGMCYAAINHLSGLQVTELQSTGLETF